MFDPVQGDMAPGNAEQQSRAKCCLHTVDHDNSTSSTPRGQYSRSSLVIWIEKYVHYGGPDINRRILLPVTI